MTARAHRTTLTDTAADELRDHINELTRSHIHRERFPKDSKILQDVLLAAQSHSDLHPTLGGLLDPDEDPEEGS